MANDYLKSIDARLSRIEAKLDIDMSKVEDRVDILEAREERRKGALWVIGIALTGLSYIGSNIKDWLS
jgi:energy-converting hydrogenase Eha subunit H